MSDQDLDQAIRGILNKYGELGEVAMSIDAEQDLYSVGLSSLSTVAVVMALEDELDIELPDEVLTKQTFGSVASIRAAVTPLVEV